MCPKMFIKWNFFFLLQLQCLVYLPVFTYGQYCCYHPRLSVHLMNVYLCCYNNLIIIYTKYPSCDSPPKSDAGCWNPTNWKYIHIPSLLFCQLQCQMNAREFKRFTPNVTGKLIREIKTCFQLREGNFFFVSIDLYDGNKSGVVTR